MIAFKIIESDVKPFMNKLLKEDVFDAFEVRGIEVATFTRFNISGISDKDYRTEQDDQAANYCTWFELKPFVMNILKGGKRPKSIKVTFSLPPAQAEAVSANASAMFLNMQYEAMDNEVLFSTATSQKNFTLEKSVDFAWEEYVREFCKTNKISFVEC